MSHAHPPVPRQIERERHSLMDMYRSGGIARKTRRDITYAPPRGVRSPVSRIDPLLYDAILDR
jgi:hypothetical protein